MMRAAAAAMAGLAVWCWGSLARAEVTDEEVRQCIARAVGKLKRGQKADGHWETVSNRYAGMSALAVLALVSAGEPLDDAVVSKGLKALEGVPDAETYVVSFRLMAFAKAEQIAGKPLYRRQIQGAVKWLEGAQSGIGTWGYDARLEELGGSAAALYSATDNSNTQLALLALYEAARAGYAVSEAVWKKSEDYYVRTQLSDGGWGYRHEGASSAVKWPSYGSMTAAGLASLAITGSQLNVATDCGCAETGKPKYRTYEPMAQSLAWLTKNFSIEKNPGLPANTWHFYYLYAVERVGILSGLKFIGQHDWFREGAEYLVRHQLADGSFARSAERGGVAPEYDTAFAILFLAKGHVPALMAKLRWSEKETDWNFNVYDLDNLCRWIGVRLNGRAVGWQTVGFGDELEEWLKSPILFISGRTAASFNSAQKAKLRKYAEEGGTIVSAACCSSKEFTESMRKLGGELFPESGPAVPLGEDHPIYGSFEKLSERWPLEGLSFGCRTNFVLSPGDLSCAWELSDRPESQAGLKVGLNIAAYATARQPLPERLASVKVLEAVPEIDAERMGLFVGKVRSRDADWNSRPRAAERLLELVRVQAGVRAASHPVAVDLDDERVFELPVLYLSGHRDPGFTLEEKQKLKRYLERGGFLLAEACCGQKAFDESFRSLMGELFPESPLEGIALDSPVLNGAAGHRIDKVSYSGAVSEEQPQLNRPRLEGVKLGDRYVVIYTPYGLAPGLDGIQPFHARSYAGEDGRRLALNIIMYALKF